MKLRLLGGAFVEDVPYLIIDADDLKHEAMAAHDAWLADPTPAKREHFAYRLMAWARDAGNTKAIRHADWLLAGMPEGGCSPECKRSMQE